MTRAEFYKSLRRRNSGVFGTSLSQGQVDGLEAILDAGQGYPLSHVAYALATARGEVGPKMQPTSENLRYTTTKALNTAFRASRFQGNSATSLLRNPMKLANTVYGGAWGKANLGNDRAGDGWVFRGRGFPMATGRRNYTRLTALTGVDLVNNPDLMMRMDISAKASLFVAMSQGLYTGKSFADYLPADRATRAQFKAARRIINGQFHADKIAAYAVDFQDALIAAGYEQTAAPAPTLRPITHDDPQAPRMGLFAWFMSFFTGRF